MSYFKIKTEILDPWSICSNEKKISKCIDRKEWPLYPYLWLIYPHFDAGIDTAIWDVYFDYPIIIESIWINQSHYWLLYTGKNG